MEHFHITIGGRTVGYLKRVGHGSPYVRFEGLPAVYTKRVAKGWLNTCREYFQQVEMVPATTRHIGTPPEAS